MSHNVKNIFQLSIGVIFTTAVMSAYPQTTVNIPQSSVMTPPNQTTWVHCPQVQVMTTSQVLVEQTQNINLGPGVSDPNNSFDGGRVVFVVGNGGGKMYMGNSAGCDSNYPYICGMWEQWILGVGTGTAALSYYCCSTPQPPMALKYDNTTWDQGNSCIYNGTQPAAPSSLFGFIPL